MRCPVGFSGEFIAVFQVKLAQSDTENDKNLKFFNIQKFCEFFLRIFDRLCELEQ